MAHKNFQTKEIFKLLILCATCVCSIKAATIKFTTEGATANSYEQFITDFRDHLSAGDIHNIPVLQDPSITEERARYTTVELSNSETESITIGIDMTNLYVVAYSDGTRSYFLRDAPPSSSNYLFTGTQQYTLPFNGTYLDLEGWAHRCRERIFLGLDSLRHAIYFLRSGGEDNEERAQALIVIVQMVAEAARFRYISERVATSIRNNSPFQPDGALTTLENSWDGLSTGVQQSTQGTFENAVNLRTVSNRIVSVDSLSHPTLAVLALMLFVCRQDAQQSPLFIRSIVEKSKTCGVFEPTVRISGRNGMCVDVSGNEYHNGNAIIIWPCKEQLEKNQLWTLKHDKTIRSGGKCLTTYGYDAGNYVMIYDCNTAVPEATYWEILENGTIVNPQSGLVLSAENGSKGGTLTVQNNEYRMRQGWRTGNDTSPLVTAISGYSGLCMEAHGNRMWLAECDTTKDEQQWSLYPDGSIRQNRNTNNCLTSEEQKQGATIVMMDCSNAWASQRWVFKSDGTIYSLFDEMVMDVKGSDPSLKQVILWPFTGNENQMWLPLLS